MRSLKIVSSLGGAAFALAAIAGCGSGSEGEVDFAKLPPPSQKVIDRAKVKAPVKPPPKFGSPPRSNPDTP